MVSVRGSGFFMISNQPEIGRNNDLYIYAINSDTSDGTIEFSKPGGLPSDSVKTGKITPDSVSILGCFMQVSSKSGRFRYGMYNAKFISDNLSPSLLSETFVKPPTELLDTSGVYTVTIYPASDSGTALSCPVSIGVKLTPGCREIVWCKGKKRNVHRGPRFTLTSTDDAGLYTIFRPTRGKRGWFVQIRVIAASCPENSYLLPPGVCTAGITCKNGGVLMNEDDVCICPPFFSGDDCGCVVPAVSGCPQGWEFRRNFCYFLEETAMNFQDAEDACKAKGAHLASVHCKAEDNFLHGLLGTPPVPDTYIGLNDRDTENDFVFTDGTEMVYSGFPVSGSQPDNGGVFGGPENCVVLRKNAWIDTSCSDEAPSICKMPAPIEKGFPLLVDTEDGDISCSDLPGGNPKCRGHLICYGDNYGCKCSSGWWGNACNRPCQKGRYGANCEQYCPKDENTCDRFVGPSSNSGGKCNTPCGPP